jgi:hypothetical protein
LNKLKTAFDRAKDYRRILQDDPEIIGVWFKLVEDTKAKYGIYDDACTTLMRLASKWALLAQ